MDDPKWLRLMTIGLILAALAVGYFLFSGRLSSNSVKTGSQANVSSSTSATPSASVLGQNAKATLTPSPKPTPASAYSRIADRTQNQVSTLPKTGFPEALAGIFSIGIMITGWGLHKYPH